MQLLKPVRVTLASNVQGKLLLNDELIGDAVIGWIEQRQRQGADGKMEIYPQMMLGVVWIGRTVGPAVSIYHNEELVSLGLSEEFEVVEEDYEDEDEDDSDETSQNF